MPKKVLIIEDNPMDASIVKELLVDEGFEVSTAFCGQEGLEKALQIRPDLILLDLMLPDMSGFEVCRRLKSEEALSKAIVVVLTIKEEKEDIDRAFAVNADDYIIKPSMPEVLARKVRLYLGKKN